MRVLALLLALGCAGSAGDGDELADAAPDGGTAYTASTSLPDCSAGELDIWLGESITLRVGDETDTLERTEGRTANVGEVTVVYRGRYLSVVRPAAAIEYVPLATCQVLPR
jgi:hypothetical protein